jgi:hypothetical protein
MSVPGGGDDDRICWRCGVPFAQTEARQEDGS